MNFSNTADFTPHLIKNRSNSVKETNRSITPTNSTTRFNYIAVGSMSTLTNSINHVNIKKTSNSPKHHERGSTSAISQIGETASTPTQGIESSKFASTTFVDMNTSGSKTPKAESSSTNINIIKNMNFNRKTRSMINLTIICKDLPNNNFTDYIRDQ